jgi:integrase
MLEFSRWLDKPVKDLTKDDIDDFFVYLRTKTCCVKGKEKHYSESSIDTVKVAVKTFLNWDGQKELADFKTKNPKSRKIPEDLLTTEDIEKLINACQNPRDSALISVLYELGARKGELTSVKLKHVTFDENGAFQTLNYKLSL